MARFSGIIGYAVPHFNGVGVWAEQYEERKYKGDIVKNRSNAEQGTSINDDIRFNNTVSIIADPYALTNYSNIRYISWNGCKWKVTSVEVEKPRLILNFGGIFNE